MQHYAYLVEGIYILLQDNVSQAELKTARQLLRMFYSEYTALYGGYN